MTRLVKCTADKKNKLFEFKTIQYDIDIFNTRHRDHMAHLSNNSKLIKR